MRHFLAYSIVSCKRWKNGYYAIFLLFFACLFLSCAAPSASPPAAIPAPDAQLLAQRKTIQQLTDRILLALATRNYQNLAALLEPVDSQSDIHLAVKKLLGSHWRTLLLDSWDANRIDVVFDDDKLWATARVQVQARLAPNRNPAEHIFSFRFHRSSDSAPWRLFVP